MIVVDVNEFLASSMTWIRQYNDTYNESEYFVNNKVGFRNGVDDQILAEILGLTEA